MRPLQGRRVERWAFRGRCPRLLSCALAGRVKPTSFFAATLAPPFQICGEKSGLAAVPTPRAGVGAGDSAARDFYGLVIATVFFWMPWLPPTAKPTSAPLALTWSLS